jgi:hypothetical protein
MGQTMLTACFSKTSGSTCDRIPQQGRYVQEWTGETEKLLQVALNKVERIEMGSVFLYGAGGRAKQISNLLFSRNKTIKGCISSYPSEIGTTLIRGLPIYAIETVQSGDTILIATEPYEAEIYESIKHLEPQIRIIRIFTEA